MPTTIRPRCYAGTLAGPSSWQWTWCGRRPARRINTGSRRAMRSRARCPARSPSTAEVDVREVAGQRDHSWGVRDWWAMDWVWSALHLDDGTHIHGVDIRIHGAQPIGIGYLQPTGRPLIELQAVTARETFGDNGLPQATTIDFGDLTTTIDIRGHAPVLLTSPDGRVSHFPRAWATVTTDDGRTGVGWVEWNRNIS